MVTVVQVNRYLIPANRGGDRRQVISETDDSGLAVSPEDCWAWILTIETPDVCWGEIRMELMEPGLCRDVVFKLGRCELGPARMRRSVSFTGIQISELGWWWTQLR